MMRLIPRLRHSRRDDDGTTLVELLVSMTIFSIIMGIITFSITSMLQSETRNSGQVGTLEAAQRVIQRLDRQVRYANAVTTPGTGTDGNFYVEYITGNTGQQQTCTQWRYVTSGGALQFRTWQPPLSGSGTVTPTAWATAATSVSAVSPNPIFSITPTSSNQASADNKQQLLVQFQVTSNGQNTAFQTTLAAINSNNSSPVAGTCTEVGRP